MISIDEINRLILEYKEKVGSVKEISDGHHTIREYIDMRNTLFVALCNAYPNVSWKSKKHYDEENDPMFNGDFIAGINTSDGPITFHLKMRYWDTLIIKELDHAPKYDNYSTEDVMNRIKSLKH